MRRHHLNFYLNNLNRLILTTVLLSAATSTALQAEDFFVSSAGEIETRASQLGAGDRMIIADGTYHGVDMLVSGSGSEGNRIVIRSQNAGNVTFSGTTRIVLSGSHIEFRDIIFREGGAEKDLITMNGSDNRVTGCVFDSFNEGGSGGWVDMGRYSYDNRLDHCVFLNKTTGFNTVFSYLPNNTNPRNHRVDHNYFQRPPLDANGGSALRFGSGNPQGGNPDKIIGVVVEYNLFEHSDGENEIITVKSSGNTIQYNTFLNSEGRLSLRHGKNNTVRDNFFLYTDGSLRHADGVVVRGEGMKVLNNYFEGLKPDNRFSMAAISLYAGYGKDIDLLHEVAYDATIQGNLVANTEGLSLSLATDFEFVGSNGKPKNVLPQDIRIIGNTFLAKDGEIILDDEPGNTEISWTGNVAWGGPVGITPPPSGVVNAQIQLVRDDDGVLRPSEISGRPLTRNDVGPDWYQFTPSQARFVRPGNGALNIVPDTLKWTDSGEGSTYHVHFGKTMNPPLISTQSELSVDIPGLDPGTTYYWRVDVENSAGLTTGNTWHFTTAAAPVAIDEFLGFPVIPEGDRLYVNTESWVGYLDVTLAESTDRGWVYSYTIQQWLYISGYSAAGAWAYALRA